MAALTFPRWVTQRSALSTQNTALAESESERERPRGGGKWLCDLDTDATNQQVAAKQDGRAVRARRTHQGVCTAYLPRTIRMHRSSDQDQKGHLQEHDDVLSRAVRSYDCAAPRSACPKKFRSHLCHQSAARCTRAAGPETKESVRQHQQPPIHGIIRPVAVWPFWRRHFTRRHRAMQAHGCRLRDPCRWVLGAHLQRGQRAVRRGPWAARLLLSARGKP